MTKQEISLKSCKGDVFSSLPSNNPSIGNLDETQQRSLKQNLINNTSDTSSSLNKLNKDKHKYVNKPKELKKQDDLNKISEDDKQNFRNSTVKNIRSIVPFYCGSLNEDIESRFLSNRDFCRQSIKSSSNSYSYSENTESDQDESILSLADQLLKVLSGNTLAVIFNLI